MKEQNLMKTILGIKIFLVAVIFAIYQNWIHLGDVKLFAEEKTSKVADASDEKSTETTSEKSKNDDRDKSDSAVSPQDAVAADEKEKSRPPEAQRKSFLADLFTLPKLNAKKIQKEEIGKYMDMAERKERQVDERTQQLAKREEQLKALERSIEEKLVRIDEERKFLGTTIQQEKDLKGERVDKLVELFDKMEPKKAAPAFEKLDKDLTVILFKRLKQKQVTTILELMNPDKSVEITEYFARVKSAKEYDILKDLNESLKKEFDECKGMPSGPAVTSNATPSANESKKSENVTK